MTTDVVASLTKLLADFSNGEWEHGMGITLENLDNPGWSLRICVTGTPYEAIEFEPSMIDRSEEDWVHLDVSKEAHLRFLRAVCGVQNLQEACELAFGALEKYTRRVA